MPNMYGRRWRGGLRNVRKNFSYSKGFLPIKKGYIVTVFINDISDKGDGVAKIDKFCIFIPGAKEGDIVTVKIMEVRQNCAVGKKLWISGHFP